MDALPTAPIAAVHVRADVLARPAPLMPVPPPPGDVLPAQLSNNEGAFGASPKAIAAAQAALQDAHRYPDAGHAALRAAIGRVHGLDPANIVCALGSTELIQLVLRCFAEPGDELLMPANTFVLYRHEAKLAGIVPVLAPERDDRTDIDALLALVTERTRVVVVANPNNPTGTWVPASEIARLRAGLPDSVLLVLDAAYGDFLQHPDFDEGFALAAAPAGNVLVLKTFSKVYGLAGMRIGWGTGATTLIQTLNKVRGMVNISVAGLAAATAAVEDREHVAAALAYNARWRPWLEALLARAGLRVTPSVCNFVMARPDGGQDAVDTLERHLASNRIYVRKLIGFGIPGALRVSVGTEEEMGRLEEVLLAGA